MCCNFQQIEMNEIEEAVENRIEFNEIDYTIIRANFLCLNESFFNFPIICHLFFINVFRNYITKRKQISNIIIYILLSFYCKSQSQKFRFICAHNTHAYPSNLLFIVFNVKAFSVKFNFNSIQFSSFIVFVIFCNLIQCPAYIHAQHIIYNIQYLTIFIQTSNIPKLQKRFSKCLYQRLD